LSETGRFFYLDAQTYTLDVKSRLALPAKFRNAVHEDGLGELILTVGQGCLIVYPEDVWEKILSGGLTNDKTGLDSQSLNRGKKFAISRTTTVVTDAQGRIHIPNSFLEYARLKRDVYIYSNGVGLELWNKADFDEIASSASDFNLMLEKYNANTPEYWYTGKVKPAGKTANEPSPQSDPD
jgi:division/cell wall cluster transcriptional repressor MraZ